MRTPPPPSLRTAPEIRVGKGQRMNTLKDTAKIGLRRIGEATSGLRPLPDFLIIGTQKGGTSSLYRHLWEHPSVRRAIAKEVHYFDLHFHRGEGWYRAHFPMTVLGRNPAATRPITGEATPYYLFHPQVPARVAGLLPETRFVALLRDPVDRLFSHYHHEVALGFERRPLEQALKEEPAMISAEEERLRRDRSATSRAHQHFSYFTRGLYATQLEAWFKVIPRERFLIVNSERFFRSTSEVYDEVLRFLGLPQVRPSNFAPSNARKYEPPPPEQAAQIREAFAPHNGRLFALLGEDLGWSPSV
jgi:hypothetical protein